MAPRPAAARKGRKPRQGTGTPQGTSDRSSEASPATSAAPIHRNIFAQSPRTPNPDSDTDSVVPLVLVSPVKARERRDKIPIKKMHDVDVWDMDDDIIIQTSSERWISDVYDHYNLTLEREIDKNGKRQIIFVFTCKFDPDHVSKRPRMGTHDGTQNLRTSKATCDRKRGEVPKGNANAAPVIPYSEAAHRALIALRCTKYHRSFNSVLDEEYQAEVNMLRPGTKIPHPITVSRDVQTLHSAFKKHVENYFKDLGCTVHIALDGWTAPITVSILGIVVIWQVDGDIHRAILEFVELTQKHDGEYLAKTVGGCLRSFGLIDKIHVVCMDNASNCDSLAQNLPKHAPKFLGMASRTQCFAHIVNLVAKSFISFFFRKPERKKAVRIAADAVRTNQARTITEPSMTVEAEHVLAAGDELPIDAEEAISEEAEVSLTPIADDDGMIVHDNIAVKSFQGRALELMKAEGITVSSSESRMGMQLFPRMAGLSRRVHDSTELKKKFDALVDADPGVTGTSKTLERRVPTRWNSDLGCLRSHIYFKEVVQQLTAGSGLEAYRLSDDQWELAQQVEEVLLLFEKFTKLFSMKDVPLVVEALPELEALEKGLLAVWEDVDAAEIIRVAAQAALLVLDKYSVFANNCEVYIIAIVMCPDRKLKWFKDHHRTSAEIKNIKITVVERWKASYKKEEPIAVQSQPKHRVSKYAVDEPEEDTTPLDDIARYLSEPLVTPETIELAGGYLKYWNKMKKTRPQVAQMGLDFCSAPTSSVDCERAFSSGRLQINHLQHNMSTETFKAQMELGSWARSPLFPGLQAATNILSAAMK